MESSLDGPYHVTLEVENQGCKGLRMLGDYNVQEYVLSDIRSTPEGLTRHLIKMPPKGIPKIPPDTITKVYSSGKSNRISVLFDSVGCEVCNTLLSNNAFLVSGRHVKNHTIIYTFVTPNFTSFKNVISTLESSGLKVTILEATRFTPKGKVLTEKQERVLWFALKLGFFEVPRKITMLELSRKLGVGLSTLSEISRRGVRRILEQFFTD